MYKEKGSGVRLAFFCTHNSQHERKIVWPFYMDKKLVRITKSKDLYSNICYSISKGGCL
jgi:hypothetical protein